MSHARRLLRSLLLLVVGLGPAAAAPTPDQVAAWVSADQLAPLTTDAVTFVQISDTHTREPSPDPAYSSDFLRRALADIRALYPQAAFVVATGDNANGPNTKWKAAFDAALASTDLRTFAVPGNVDYGCYLGAWDLGPPPDREAFLRPVHHQHAIAANLFLFLDSHLPRSHEGCLRPDQLLWLHRLLAEQADRNVFLFLHHPLPWLMNADHLTRILQAHRARYRQIVLVSGHEHCHHYADRDGLHQFVTSHLSGGLYRVFHVRPDAIVSYMRQSRAWLAIKEPATQPAPDRPDKTGSLAARPVVIPSEARSAARPLALDDPAYRQLAADLAWPANEPDQPGLILDLRLDEGAGHVLADSSPWHNHLYANDLFLRRKKTPEDRFAWIPHPPGFAMDFGQTGCFEAVGFDSHSLNSPARTNQLTLEVQVYIPQQPIGWDYGLVGKGAYELRLDTDGKAGLRLWLQGPKGRHKLTLLTPAPLPAGQWHHLRGTFDGTAAALYCNGELAAEERLGPGYRLLGSDGPIVVGFNQRHPRDAPSRALWIDNVRVWNQVVPPPAAPGDAAGATRPSPSRP